MVREKWSENPNRSNQNSICKNWIRSTIRVLSLHEALWFGTLDKIRVTGSRTLALAPTVLYQTYNENHADDYDQDYKQISRHKNDVAHCCSLRGVWNAVTVAWQQCICVVARGAVATACALSVARQTLAHVVLRAAFVIDLLYRQVVQNRGAARLPSAKQIVQVAFTMERMGKSGTGIRARECLCVLSRECSILNTCIRGVKCTASRMIDLVQIRILYACWLSTVTINKQINELTKISGVVHHGEHLALGTRTDHTRCIAGTRELEIEPINKLMLPTTVYWLSLVFDQLWRTQ